MGTFITPIKPMAMTGLDTEQTTQVTAGLPFQKILGQAMENMETSTEMGQADSFDLAFGDINDLAQVQINSLKAQAMAQTTVQLTSRVVSAYKEIMQMQI